VFEDLIRSWDGEEVAVHYDHPSGTWMFVCIHSSERGPAGGGTRMTTYPTPADGLADAMRLSAAMTLKMAATDIPFGGGKAVLAVPALPEGDERRRLLLRYGDLAASLGGNFQTGPDVNTTIADMDVIAERHAHVFCRSEERGGSGDPGPYTARGVFHGIRASAGHAFGSPDLDGRSVLVQGVGDVGARLAEQLAEAGARVLLSDIDTERANHLAAHVGAEVVPAETAMRTDCDIYAPCALGGTLSAETIPHLRCRIGMREQPARGDRGRRPPGTGRDPVRTRLRDQRRGRHPRVGRRIVGLGPRHGRNSARRGRHHPHRHLRVRRGGGDYNRGRG
jgi:leucine dehydrogenase